MNIARERSSREYIAKNGEKEFLVVFNAYYYKPACICLKYEKIVHNAHHSVLLSPAGKISWYSASFLVNKKLPDHLCCHFHAMFIAIGHIRYINIFKLFCLNSQKRLRYKENNTKYSSLTWEPRSHVRILIYRTWPIVSELSWPSGYYGKTRSQSHWIGK